MDTFEVRWVGLMKAYISSSNRDVGQSQIKNNDWPPVIHLKCLKLGYTVTEKIMQEN